MVDVSMVSSSSRASARARRWPGWWAYHLAGQQPIAQPADGGQVLLDRGRAIFALLNLVDVGGHGDR